MTPTNPLLLCWRKREEFDATLFDGDTYLVAVPVQSADKKKQWWEFNVVTVTEFDFEVEGSPWGWEWTDAEWVIPVKTLASTLPKYEH